MARGDKGYSAADRSRVSPLSVEWGGDGGRFVLCCAQRAPNAPPQPARDEKTSIANSRGQRGTEGGIDPAVGLATRLSMRPTLLPSH
jgi:hypothetical protein